MATLMLPGRATLQRALRLSIPATEVPAELAGPLEEFIDVLSRFGGQPHFADELPLTLYRAYRLQRQTSRDISLVERTQAFVREHGDTIIGALFDCSTLSDTTEPPELVRYEVLASFWLLANT